jgi:putative PIN family toxin of toxin-antitoxin system
VIRVVVDPGVFVSAFISPRRSAPALIVEAIFARRLEVVVSAKLLGELREVLGRDKFAKYAENGRSEAFITAISDCAFHVQDPDAQHGLTEDPGDDYLVALATTYDVDAIVAGDRHLLEISSEALPVWTPRTLATRLEAPATSGEQYLKSTAKILVALRESAGIEHVAVAITRPVGEALVLHVTPDGRAWWTSSRHLGDLRVLRGIIGEVAAEDEMDVTNRARAFDPSDHEDGEMVPIDDLFGSMFWELADVVGGDRGVLMARDAVERTWLAWRYESGKVYSVEETPGYFDEQLKFINSIADSPLDGRGEKPALRIAAVGDPRVIDMHPEVAAAFELQLENFREKFGRDPGPDDPIFFDPDADDPRPLPAEEWDRIGAVVEELGFDEERRQQLESTLIAEGKIRKISRNDPCPCGSGKKYKRCCGG